MVLRKFLNFFFKFEPNSVFIILPNISLSQNTAGKLANAMLYYVWVERVEEGEEGSHLNFVGV
jgi:hypothetical protein